MTREEAIGHLRNMKMPHDKFYEETDETNKTLIDKGNEALDMATKALEQTRWIPVSERLPNFNDIVLASTDSDYDELRVILTVYRDEEFWFNGKIKAWMPLPKPYKAESEDKG